MQQRTLLWLCFAFWLIISLWQAAFAQLIPDEAYYWLYSQNLDWGYFDHPPAVAVMIKAGYALLHNQLGVRLFAVLLTGGSLVLLYLLARPQKTGLFIAVVASIVPLHLLGIFALPDVPLLFFTCLFFYALKQYLEWEGSKLWWLVMLAVVGTFYSKYHAVLVVFFTLLAVPKVFRYRSFYVILFGSLLLYFPHIYWQVSHNYPSVKYHLVERNQAPWSINMVFDYFAGQWLMFGTLSALPFLYFIGRHKSQNLFDKVLLYNLVGVFIFFLIMSFRGHIEPNWTVPFWPPFILLSYAALANVANAQRWLGPLSAISVAAIFATKVWLTAPLADHKWFKYDSFHGWKNWVEAVHQHAGNTPVVFTNSYQQAAQYMFYAQAPAFSHNVPYVRGNQFNYWHYEEGMIGKDAMLVPADWLVPTDSQFFAFRDTVKYKWLHPYLGFGKIRLTPVNLAGKVNTGESLHVKLLVTDQFNNRNFADLMAGIEPDIVAVYNNGEGFIPPVKSGIKFNRKMIGDTIELGFKAPVVPGNYFVSFSFDAYPQMLMADNSGLYKLKVTGK